MNCIENGFSPFPIVYIVVEILRYRNYISYCLFCSWNLKYWNYISLFICSACPWVCHLLDSIQLDVHLVRANNHHNLSLHILINNLILPCWQRVNVKAIQISPTFPSLIISISIFIESSKVNQPNQNRNHLRWWIDPESASVSLVISKLLWVQFFSCHYYQCLFLSFIFSPHLPSKSTYSLFKQFQIAC